MLKSKHHICRENANAVNCHARDPETNILSIGLVSAYLHKYVERSHENETSVNERVEEPFNKEPCRETCSFNSDSVQHGVFQKVALELVSWQFHLHVNILLMLQIINGVEEDWEGCHSDIVHLIDQLLVQGLAGERSKETEVELWHDI